MQLSRQLGREQHRMTLRMSRLSYPCGNPYRTALMGYLIRVTVLTCGVPIEGSGLRHDRQVHRHGCGKGDVARSVAVR